MRYTQLLDPFKNRQPEMTFSADLAKPLHTEKPIGWNSCAPEESEIDFSKIELRDMLLSALKELRTEYQIVLIKFYFQGKKSNKLQKKSTNQKQRLKLGLKEVENN